MRQQPTLMCVCYHSTTYPCSVICINRGSSFYRLRFPPPPCLYFASLQTDSENRSLVRRRMRDGRSRQGRDLCKNRHAILITAIHAMKCQTCTVTTPRRGPWLLISPLFVLIIQTGVWSIIYHVCKRLVPAESCMSEKSGQKTFDIWNAVTSLYISSVQAV